MNEKSHFRATLTKLNANTKDKLYSIQFQLREEEMEEHGKEVLELRRYDQVRISVENPQSYIGTQWIEFFSVEFQSLATSISICVTEKGLICTITFSLEDREVFNKLVLQDLRNKVLHLEFEDGANPYQND